MKKKSDLISLNSKIFEEVSIEELEERLELSGGWVGCDCTTQYGCMCYTDDMSCAPVNNTEW